MIRLLLADDELMVRAGVRTILESAGDMEVIAEAADDHAAVEAARGYRPDVALLDIRMPVLDGLAAAEQILELVPQTRVAILTTFGEDRYVASALHLGVSGFLLKIGDPQELLSGVRAVAGGAAFLSPQVTTRVLARWGGGLGSRATIARERLAALSPREREAVFLVAEGLSNTDIAGRLHVTEGTVKSHVSNALARLHLDNRVQLAILGYEARLSDP